MSLPMLQQDLRALPRHEQANGARKFLAEIPSQRPVELLASAPLYGLCVSLLEGGQKFSWRQLDVDTWRITATKSSYPPLNAVTGLHHPAILPDNGTVCATDREERLWLIDGTGNQVLGDIVVGGNASHLAVHPEGHLIYVGCPGADQVAVVDARKHTKLASIPIGKGGQLPNFSPDGRYAVIDCSRTNDVYLMDAERHRVIFTQGVGEAPHEAIFSPDGRFICVPCASGELYLIPPQDPDRFTVIRCGFGAGHMDFSADARYAYVASSLDDDVAIIDLTTQELLARVPAGAGAHRPTLSEDGRLLFVANFVADTVTVMDTRSREVIATLPVGTYPHDVVRAPGGQIAVCSYGSGSCTLIDPEHSLASRELKIGEGTSHCTFSPDGELGFFANSISKDLAVVDLTRPELRSALPVSSREN